MFILSGCGWLPAKTINIIHIAYNVVRMAIPAIIVVMGSIDFLKSIASASDDEIRKNTNNFIHKLIGAAIAFIIPAAVGWIAQVMADSNASQGVTCMNAMLNGTYTADQGLPAQGHAKNEQQQKELANCKASCNGNQACLEACDGKYKPPDEDQNPPQYNNCYEQCMANPPQKQSDYHADGFYVQSYNECMAAINVGDVNSKINQYKEAWEECIEETKDYDTCKDKWNLLYNIADQYGTTATGDFDYNEKACVKYAETQYNNYTNNSISTQQTCETYCHQDREYTNVK